MIFGLLLPPLLGAALGYRLHAVLGALVGLVLGILVSLAAAALLFARLVVAKRRDARAPAAKPPDAPWIGR